MTCGYARVSTDGQSVDAQVRQLTKAGCKKVFGEVASGAWIDRTQLCKALDQLDYGDVLMVARVDRLARSTRDLLNMLDTVVTKGAGFRSLGDTCADTMTPHGRLILTVLGGLAEFGKKLIKARIGQDCSWPRLLRPLDASDVHHDGARERCAARGRAESGGLSRRVYDQALRPAGL